MRTVQDIENQKTSRTTTALKTQSYSLPPGYVEGFQQVISSNQLVLKKGIADIRGKIIRASSKDATSDVHYILNWEDFIVPNATVLRGMTYYIYMESGGKHLIDVLIPYYDTNSFGWYHRTLYPYRYIQSFYIDSSGNYLASEILMGYNGTGSNDAPHEGDWRVIMFQGAQKTQEYTAGTWVNRMHFGYLVLGLLLTMVGCTGIFHPSVPPVITEFLPQGDFRLFNFENNYQDQDGLATWVTNSHATFTVINPKFGAYCVGDDNANANATIWFSPPAGSGYASGESQSAAGWFNFSLINAQHGVLYLVWSTDNIRIEITAGGLIYLTVMQSSVDSLTITGDTIVTGGWHQIGYAYDKVTNVMYLIIDDRKFAGTPSGTWAGVEEASWLETLPGRYVAGTYTVRYKVDALLSYPNYFLDPDILVQHFNHRVNWTTDGRSLMDMTISAGPGGSIHLMDDTIIDTQLTVPKIAGNHEITGNLDVDGNLNVDGSAVIDGNISSLNGFPQRVMMWHDEATVITGNAIGITVDSRMEYCLYSFQAPPANGDSFSNSFFLKAGTYNFKVLGLMYSGCGKIDWYIDGVKVVSLQDWYSASDSFNVIKTASVTVTGDGYHKLVGTINGKTGSNYYIELQKYWFVPASDPARG